MVHVSTADARVIPDLVATFVTRRLAQTIAPIMEHATRRQASVPVNRVIRVAIASTLWQIFARESAQALNMELVRILTGKALTSASVNQGTPARLVQRTAPVHLASPPLTLPVTDVVLAKVANVFATLLSSVVSVNASFAR